MGACCSGRKYTDNEVENFIRDAISNYTIATRSYSDVTRAYDHIVDVQKLADHEVHSVNEVKFNNLVKDHYYVQDSTKNPYAVYQHAAIPTYDEVCKNQPKYTVLLNALSLVSDREKFRHILELVKLKYDQNNYENVSKFIFDYVEANLKTWTERIIDRIQMSKDKVEIQVYTIDTEFKNTAHKLLKEFSLARFENLADVINKELEIIVYKQHKDLKESDLKTEKVNEEDLLSLTDTLPWLFDALSLRDYYWKHYVEKQ